MNKNECVNQYHEDLGHTGRVVRNVNVMHSKIRNFDKHDIFGTKKLRNSKDFRQFRRFSVFTIT